MSDDRLRELERRWKTTGTVEDEAAWLKERVRAGELASEDVELAAYLEDPAALLVAGPQPDPGHGSWFTNLLQRWGVGPAVCAAAFFGEECVAAWEKEVPADQRPRTAVDFAVRWASSPDVSPTAAEAAETAMMEADDAAEDARRDDRSERMVKAALAAMGAARCASWAAMGAAWSGKVLEDCRWVAEISAEITGIAPEELRRAVAHRLAQWALDVGSARPSERS